MKQTNEFSFVLKPSSIHGIGIFVIHDIEKDTFLELFPNGYKKRNKNEVPEQFKNYCLLYPDGYWTPMNFSSMDIGWYINHSKNPNTYVVGNNYDFYALRDIKCGEELTVDYNTFDECEEL